MSLSLVTHGMLGGTIGGGEIIIIKEQYTAIQTAIEQIYEIQAETADIDQVSATVTTDGITVEIQLLDTVTGSLADENFDVDIDF